MAMHEWESLLQAAMEEAQKEAITLSEFVARTIDDWDEPPPPWSRPS